MALDVSTWKDTAAIEAWLLDQTMREDAALDLCAMALALALHGRPEAKPAAYAAHLDRLVAEVARSPG
ncbi:MAG: hypothetical protein ACREIP_21360, partial [Alphaproteobacteria bacterium]